MGVMTVTSGRWVPPLLGAFITSASPGFMDNPLVDTDTVGKVAGFSLHAGVSARAHERHKLERLCRYITRPAVSNKRLSLTRNGKVRYELKTPYSDGTTHVAVPAHPCAHGISASMHVIFEPLDFMYRMYGMPRAQGCA